MSKREIEEEQEDEWVGPRPSEAKKAKVKVLAHEKTYLENMPCSERYEKSYMHRDTVTHVAVTKTDFVCTCSSDGHVKFWKKQERGIEFVKHFRAHLAPITSMSVSYNGELMATVSEDKAMKIFDVINFDMINMMKLDYVPLLCEWIYSPLSRIKTIALAKEDSKIYVYDGKGSSEPLQVLEKLHASPVKCIKFCPNLKFAISTCENGIIEYWSGQEKDYAFPKHVVKFKLKSDTSLYKLAQEKTYAVALAVSEKSNKFACLTANKKIMVFHLLTGKLSRVFDEGIKTYVELHQSKAQLADMEFGRRVAVEREVEKCPKILAKNNLIFDETGNFLVFSSMLGIKLLNLFTSKCCKIVGKPENLRLLSVDMFQGSIARLKASLTVDMQASDNPALKEPDMDPIIFATAFKKNRFYMFSRFSPEDLHDSNVDRDVFNERPTKEEVMAATQLESEKRVAEAAILHTSLGDIHLKLFPKQAPKAVENFCVHARNGYYNGNIFHRIIKGFMIQTGDPLGTGTGGESIWGKEFEDEFNSTLKHDRPYTLSMANAGPNTNGSQFFVTVVPTPWLDNKHTIFGRVARGMEIVHNIAEVKVHPKTDKPYEDVLIINITVR